MKRITFVKPPLKIDITLDKFYNDCSKETRHKTRMLYDGMYDAISASLFCCVYMFGIYKFDINSALRNVSTTVDYAFGDVYLFDFDLTVEEAKYVLDGITWLIKDIYIGVHIYAQRLCSMGYELEDIPDILGEIEWDIYSDTPSELDHSREISLIINQNDEGKGYGRRG